MFYFVFLGVAVAQLLRTPHTGLSHAEKLEKMVQNLAAHAGNHTSAQQKITYSLETLQKVEQEVVASNRHKNKADPLTDEMFNPVIDQVRGIVRGNVKDTVDGLVAAAMASVKSIEKCADDFSFDATAESSGYNAAKDSMENSADSSEEDCKDVTTGEDARDNAGKTLYENVKNSVGCSQTADVADVPMDAINFPLKNINTWAQTVITQHKEWFDAANKVTTSKGECSETKLDNAESCATVEHLAGKGKQAYESCYNRAMGEFSGAVMALVSMSQATMGPQIDMVESLICYIRVAIREWDNPQSTCATTSDGKVSCDCQSDQGEVYANIIYDFSAHLGPYDLSAPEKDTSWDGKGCTDAAEEDPCEDISGVWHDKGNTEVTMEQTGCEGKESTGAWTFTVKGEVGKPSVEITLSTGAKGSVAGSKPERVISWDNGFAYTEGNAPPPTVGFALVGADEIPSGYKAVTLEELNQHKADFIKQYNTQGLNVPVKFVSQNCCIMVASRQRLLINGQIEYPNLNGQMQCNPSSGYEVATNWKFNWISNVAIPADATFGDTNRCSEYNNPMLALPA